MITKNDDMLALSERLLQLANDEGTVQIHDVALKIRRLATAQQQPCEPMAWCAYHAERNRFNFGTMADSQQAACSRLMMTGVAGNHGWSIAPLRRCSHAANVTASDGDLSQGVRRAIVNDEPFEHAIQLGPHGDEFVKLLNGECLRRPISRTPAEGDGLHRLTEKQTEAVWGLTIDEAARKIERLENELARLRVPAETVGEAELAEWIFEYGVLDDENALATAILKYFELRRKSAAPSTVSQPITRCSLPECADGCITHISECQSPDPLSETIAIPPQEQT